MKRKRMVASALGAGAGLGAAAAVGVVLQRRKVNGWRVEEESLRAAGLTLPDDLLHHDVPVSDGGRIHVVERGEGPAIVLVHGVTLGVAIWAPQFRHLARGHRVIALDLRGHGESVAGADGYTFSRMAEDVLEVLAALAVHDALYVGHSMGGMIGQTAAIEQPEALGRHVSGLVLLATSAGPLIPGPRGLPLFSVLAGGAARGLRSAERRGQGMLPHPDVVAWVARATFGRNIRLAELQLTSEMITSMSPRAMAALVPMLLGFDLHRRIGEIDCPTTVVVGTRDLLTPPRMARALAAGIPGAELVSYPDCGHMVMLERPEELNGLLHRRASAAIPVARA